MSSSKLQTSQFYQNEIIDDKEEYAKYVHVQIQRRNSKQSTKKYVEYYKKFFDELVIHLNKNKHYEMICYGTRNNNERDLWRNLFNDNSFDANVYSLDIAPGSEADFVYDFNKLPDDFENKWDIIFSNSIDHSIDATKTFYHWLKTLKHAGIAIVSFCLGTTAVTTDCSTFDRVSITKFVEENENKDFQVLKHCFDGTAFIVKKK